MALEDDLGDRRPRRRRPAAADAPTRAPAASPVLVVGGEQGDDRRRHRRRASPAGRTRTSCGRTPRGRAAAWPARPGRHASRRPWPAAARSWSASQVAGSKPRRSRRKARIERMTSGGSSSAAQELVDVDAGRRPPWRSQPPSTRTRPRAAGAELGRGPRGDDRPEPMPGQRRPGRRPRPGRGARALGDRDDVLGQDVRVVGAVLGRGVRQAVAAQVHRDGRASARRAVARPAPRSRRVCAQPVDEDHARRGRPAGRATPVEEVDPVARIDVTTKPAGSVVGVTPA